MLLSDGDNTAALDPLALAPVGRAGRRADLPDRHRQPRAARSSTSAGFQVATSLDAELPHAASPTASGGTYFAAPDARPLQRVYDTIDLKLTVAGRKTEITAIVAGAGLLLFLVAAGLSMRWYGRVI